MTPKATAALADYLAMGPGRSLEKLAEKYRGSSSESTVPTTNLRTLYQWSTDYAWQAEVLAYEQRMAAALETEATKARKKRLLLVQGAIAILAEGMTKENGKRKFKAESVRDLESLVKLEAQLLGEPLAERHEVSGPGGGPIEHECNAEPDHVAAVLAVLLGAGAVISGTDAATDASDDEVHTTPAAS